MRRIGPTYRIPLILIAAAAIVYGLLLKRYYVGYFSDDALYVISALSLLKGHFSTLCLPHQPPMNHFLPGYPLTLMPFVAAFQPHWPWLKLTSMIWTLALGWTFWLIARRMLSPRLSVIVMGCTLFNPIMISFSGVVMPEPCWTFTLALVWLTFFRLLEQDTSARQFALSAVLALSCLMRQEAILLAGAVTAGLIIARRSNRLILTLGPAVLARGGFLLRNLWLTGSPTDYLPYWQQDVGSLAARASALPGQFLFLLDVIYVRTVAGVALDPSSGLRRTLAAVLIIAGISLTLYGVTVLWRKLLTAQPVIAGITGFIVLYVGLHTFWYVHDVRYAVPLIPFIWLFIGASAGHLWKRRRARPWLGILAAVVMAGYVDQNSHAIYTAFRHQQPATQQLPSTTLRWLKEQIPSGSLLMSNKIEPIYLYTGHRGYFLLPAHNIRELHQDLQQKHVDYVMYKSALVLDTALWQRWRQTMDWIAADHHDFELAYMNKDEQTVIFKVLTGVNR